MKNKLFKTLMATVIISSTAITSIPAETLHEVGDAAADKNISIEENSGDSTTSADAKSDLEKAKKNHQEATEKEKAAKEKYNASSQKVSELTKKVEDTKLKLEYAQNDYNTSLTDQEKCESDLKEKKEAYEDASNKKSKADENAKNAEEKLATATKNVETKKAAYTKANDELNAKSKELENAQKELSDANKKLAESKNTLSEYQDNLKAEQEEKEIAQKKVDSAQKTYDSAKKKYDDASKQAANKSAEYKAAQSEVEKAEKELNAANDDVNKKSKLADEAYDAYNQKDSEYTEAYAAISDYEKQVDVANAELSVASAQENLNAAIEKLSSAQTTYDNAKAELDSAIASGNEEEIQKKQTAFDEASENLQAAQNEKEWAEEDLVNAKSEYKRLSGKEIDSIDRATAEKHLSDAEKALTEATNKANALETEAADLKAVYEKKAKDKDDAMEVCNQKNTAWQTAVNKRNAIEEKENKNLAALRDTAQQKEFDLQEAETELYKHETNIDKIETAIASEKDNYNKLAEEATSKENTVNIKKNEKNSAKKNADSAKESYDAATKEVSELQGKIDEKKTADSNYEKSKSEYESAKSKYETVKTEVSAAKDKLDTAKKQVSEAESNLSNAKKEKTEAETAYEDAKKATAKAKAELAVAQDKYNQVTPGLVKSINLSTKSVYVKIGNTYRLTATVSPEDAEKKDITWTSSNSGIVTVKNGEITAVSSGIAYVSAISTDGSGVYSTCKVMVGETDQIVLTKSIRLSANKLNIVEGKSRQLSATVSPSNATEKKVRWVTSNSKIATVDNGKVKAIAPGTVSISAVATDGSRIYSTCRVTVVAKDQEVLAKSIKLSTNKAKISRGETYQLKATLNPSNTTSQDVVWTTSNSKIATVKNGKITAIAPGTVSISAIATDGSGVYSTCKVTVGYPITYNLDGGTNSSKNPSVFYNENITFESPRKKGYKFVGWYLDGKYKITGVSTKTKKDISVTAKWKKVGKVGDTSITYVKNISSKTVKVAYKKATNATRYQIQYSTDNSFKNNVQNSYTTQTGAILRNLTKGKTYYIRVRAYTKDSTDSNTYGKFSRIAKVKVTE